MKKITLICMTVFSSLALNAQYGHRGYSADSTTTDWFNDGLITNFNLSNNVPVHVGVGRNALISANAIERARFVRSSLSGTQLNNRKYFIFKNGAEVGSRLNALAEGNSYIMASGTVVNANGVQLAGGADALIMKTTAAGVPSSIFKVDLGGGFDEILSTKRSNRSSTTFYSAGYSSLQGTAQAFLMKHTGGGVINWVKRFSLPCQDGTTGFAEITSLVDDSTSNMITVVGNVRTGPSGSACKRAFIAKINGSGVLQWLRFITSNNGTDIDLQSIRETGTAQQFVITGSIALPNLNRRVLLMVVNTAGAAPVTVWAKGLYTNGPTPNYVISNQQAFDVITRIEPTKTEYFVAGMNLYTTNLTDGIIFKTDANGTPLLNRIYTGFGKEQFNAIDYVSRPGAAGNGIAAFGKVDRLIGVGTPKGQSWLVKSYFNLVSGCNEVADNPLSVNLTMQYTTQSVSFVSTFTKDSLTTQNSNGFQTTICWATTISGGNNARFGDELTNDETMMETAEIPAEKIGLSLFPNPNSSSQLSTEIYSATQQEIALSIIDLNGKLHESTMMNVQEGKQLLNIEIEDLPPGIYLIQLRTSDGEVTSKKLIRM
jgi:hypothetical protein